MFLLDVTNNSVDTVTNSTIEEFAIDGDTVEMILEEVIESDRIYKMTLAAVNEVGVSNSSRELQFRESDIIYISSYLRFD